MPPLLYNEALLLNLSGRLDAGVDDADARTLEVAPHERLRRVGRSVRLILFEFKFPPGVSHFEFNFHRRSYEIKIL